MPFKSCLFKYKASNGAIKLADARADFMDAKYKEKHKDKIFDFNKFTNGILEGTENIKKKKTSWKDETEFEKDANGDIDPIQISDGGSLFNNDGAAIYDLRKKNN